MKIFTIILLLILTNCENQDKKKQVNNININIFQNPKNNTLNNFKTNIKPNTTSQNMRITDFKNNDYFAYMRSSNVQFEILVDDVPSYRFFGKETSNGMGMNGDVPLNAQLLKSGKHIIQGKIFPKYGDAKLQSRSFLSLDFSIRESNALTSFDLFSIEPPSSTLSEDKTKLINPIENLPYYELKSELDVQLPFEIVGWTQSVNLKDEMEKGNDLKKELKKAYDEIRKIIEKRDESAFSEIIKEREHLLATAFYLTPKEQKKELNEFLDIIKNKDYELVPYPNEINIHFYGYGKLITMFTLERESIIKLINTKDKNEVINLDFYFHRKKAGNKLEVIL